MKTVTRAPALALALGTCMAAAATGAAAAEDEPGKGSKPADFGALSGLAIGAVSPAEIAVSIVAQVIGVLRAGRRGR